MSYISSNKKIQKKMLNKIGVDSFEELIDIIPKNILLDKQLNLEESISEFEMSNKMKELSDRSKPAINGKD